MQYIQVHLKSFKIHSKFDLLNMEKIDVAIQLSIATDCNKTLADIDRTFTKLFDATRHLSSERRTIHKM